MIFRSGGVTLEIRTILSQLLLTQSTCCRQRSRHIPSHVVGRWYLVLLLRIRDQRFVGTRREL